MDRLALLFRGPLPVSSGTTLALLGFSRDDPENSIDPVKLAEAYAARVDMSKGLHFAYTSHGKSLTITLLTYTLTRFKHIFLFYQVCLAKTTKKGQFCRACSGITAKPPARCS